MEESKKEIGKVAQKILKVLFKMINRKILSRIKEVEIKESISLAVETIKKMFVALVDEDPNNSQQIREIFNQYKVESLDTNLETAKFIIAKNIKDEFALETIFELIDELKEKEG
jgi:O-phosphoseryl-tRNA(Cys) synthetase